MPIVNLRIDTSCALLLPSIDIDVQTSRTYGILYNFKYNYDFLKSDTQDTTENVAFGAHCICLEALSFPNLCLDDVDVAIAARESCMNSFHDCRPQVMSRNGLDIVAEIPLSENLFGWKLQLSAALPLFWFIISLELIRFVF